MDWDKIGLKMGLEIHQQLDSKGKLFCPCKCELTDDEPEYNIMRRLRPTQSELGKIDRAAFEEAKRKLKFYYQAYSDHTCLVEADEEPPHPINNEALETAVTIALLLNMKVVDEFHTMRKQVIDGSNTGGFQRTGLVATDGYVETPHGRVKIENLCLEEDAARRIEEKEDGIVFRLDRLGIPLVEITTDPSIKDPIQLKEVAYQIGQILRSTKVKRGIGTIRQDLNISIKDGARVEVKGVQDLDLIPEIVKREVKRQLKLLEIREKLKKRKAKVEDKIYDVGDVFKQTSSKIIKRAEKVLAVKLTGFSGIIGTELQPDRRFGTELADYAKKRGVTGLFHTDELPGYGINKKEVDALFKTLGADETDAIIIIADEEEKAKAALKEVIMRARMAIEGIPEETRKALPDGNTAYLRPLPTASRMYVETDIPPFKIGKKMIKKLQEELPELPTEKKERIMREYNLSEDLASQLVKKNLVDDFEKLATLNVDKKIIASLLAYSLQELKRDGHNIEKLKLENLKDVLRLLEEGKISKDALKDIVACVADEKLEALEAAKKLNLLLLTRKEVENIIKEIIEENSSLVAERGMGAMGPLMGQAMKKLRGKADGQLVNKILKKMLKEKI
ncbi:MAG TPA: Glu-tRNA(Gln) amidotransferase subunit GatE [Methanothermobacter sp.]|jgi:glutamyl-tRNA(Gln) amidotransferase subunit E|uniref:Glutamyl-tRNA(Gln) amidotransferase subunit E n=1 Tax=Methanothermobacter tenebrarum TaxID=680118 RepID=A0ABM7YE84_9EURY|nr:Glu-tRNA(Gln) amidotransferase subunit GatE [Methanothermobacter tenebrarum]MDD3454448.1 Glu-tRNA(Gln) amidotransferase subunit GatE [Methanobacteriales archaeon]MDI6881405.1 Glu-tRNA(Gln) amidotransferase subunit GatE [Methanothermobacter sp.]MDX9692995.1 Glu-tRNA(Gln) amidotransferase subunit GatE [Methanothermobacter sp.]BDH79679.1 glutamyl-tRNA(Gln) amidotransferase subunit E [Methanothermobacter tenebrarum]HHW16678.1 Glu-tRNA(Gln) amidotransferase subunit GatE [Methanothermobacter sp.]